MDDQNIYVSMVEDKDIYRNAVAQAIRSTKDMKLINSYINCNTAYIDFEKNLPDVLLLDIGLPDMQGTDFVRVVKEKFPTVEIIMLTVFEDEDNIFKALRNGASGYIIKEPDMDRIIEAVRNVYNGGAPLSMPVALKIVKYLHEENINLELTVREQEVLNLICKGKSNKAIAEGLFVSVSDVRFHCKNIYKKLHVTNRVEAIVKLQRLQKG